MVLVVGVAVFVVSLRALLWTRMPPMWSVGLALAATLVCTSTATAALQEVTTSVAGMGGSLGGPLLLAAGVVLMVGMFIAGYLAAHFGGMSDSHGSF